MHGFISDSKKHEKVKSHIGAFKPWKTYGCGAWVDSLISQARQDKIQRHNKKVRTKQINFENFNQSCFVFVQTGVGDLEAMMNQKIA